MGASLRKCKPRSKPLAPELKRRTSRVDKQPGTGGQMKGIVFTEFLEMVEAQFSPALADRIIGAASLPSGGAYTAVGNYDPGEMWSLVIELGKATGTPVPGLMRTFGEHLFHRFAVVYPTCFANFSSAFDFLQRLETVIHAEVRKLYPDADLPRFDVSERDGQRMVMVYRSNRPFADLAEGLLRGCARHFDEAIEIGREDLPAERGSAARFTLTRSR
jgi:hypothetical protein